MPTFMQTFNLKVVLQIDPKSNESGLRLYLEFITNLSQIYQSPEGSRLTLWFMNEKEKTKIS